MRNILVFFGLLAGALNAQELQLAKPATPHLKLWRTSVAALAVANALDVHSSWGKYELNRTLAGPKGTFGRDGALIKLAFEGGLVGFEYLITRGHPTGKVYKVLSVVNFGAAATIGGVAAHNYSVPRPPR